MLAFPTSVPRFSRVGPSVSSSDCKAKIELDGPSGVYLFHPPKTAGSWLRQALGTYGKVNHGRPADLVTPVDWLGSLSITTARHPLSRFLSGYRFHQNYDGLLKQKMVSLRSPFDYLNFLRREHHRQWEYAVFPSFRKFRVDVVLKFEEFGTWADTLRTFGVVLNLDTPPRKLSGVVPVPASPGLADVIGVTGLEEEEAWRLVRLVERHYWPDYLFFGYRKLNFHQGKRF